MGFAVPGFNPGYAVLVIVIVAVIVSLCKPEDGYVPLSWHDYKQILGESYGRFWADRTRIWTYRLIYYYSGRLIAPTLFIINALLISTIAGVRYSNKLHSKLHDLRRDADTACPNLTGDDLDVSISVDWDQLTNAALNWDRQLTTMLTVYFISRMIGATAMLGGSNRSILSSVILDSWLLGLTIWSSVLEFAFDDLTESDEFKDCYNRDDRPKEFFDNYSDALFTLNALNICLWLMISLTLPFGLVIDLVVTTIKEIRYATSDPTLSALDLTVDNNNTSTGNNNKKSTTSNNGSGQDSSPRKSPKGAVSVQSDDEDDDFGTAFGGVSAVTARGGNDGSDSDDGGIQRIITLVDGQQPNYEKPAIEMVGTTSINEPE